MSIAVSHLENFSKTSSAPCIRTPHQWPDPPGRRCRGPRGKATITREKSYRWPQGHEREHVQHGRS